MENWLDIILRLGLATAIGGAIGLNRDLHHKPTGLRTLGLVGLGSALVVLVSTGGSADAISHVVQGVITGIGFLGAGVILRGEPGTKVKGLTTAASIWVTACLGVACGVAAWRAVLVGSLLIALLLFNGGAIEKTVHARFGHYEGDDAAAEEHPPAPPAT